MRKLLVLLSLVAISAFAEPSFQQVEGLIEHQQYSAAESGLEQIIQNHPTSAKAFYAMAQAQAGLGHLEKAQFALNKARGLDPELKFASASNIESLEQAITPQVKKIEVVEESHFWRDFVYFALFCAFVVVAMFAWAVYQRKRDQDNETGLGASGTTPPSTPPSTPHGSYSSAMNAPISRATAPSYTPSSAPVASAPVASHTTVVNNNSNDGFLTGMLVADMMNSHHTDHTTIIERDVYVPTPAPTYTAPAAPVRDTSWDDDSSSRSTPSRSSSWDDTPSKSSSWSSSSSDDSSSSWSSSSSDSSSSRSDSSSSSSSSDW